VFYLVVVFIVLVVAWGAARFSILYPNNKFDVLNGTSTEKIFKKMLMIPSFQIFGELFVNSQEEAARTSMIISSLVLYFKFNFSL